MKLWKIGPKLAGEGIAAAILKQRGVKRLRAFMEPKPAMELTLKDVGINPTEVEKFKKRINKAIKKNETVVVYGDYDADGISATAIMWQGLHKLGVNVWPFIPHREEHGYGLSIKGVDAAIKERGPSLVVTVDNGITANQVVEYLREKNIDVLVTDHHQPGEDLPQVKATIHTTKICGAGVAWMIIKELDQGSAESSLDLVALGTIADMMPVLGPNRSLVKYGLERLKKTKRVGLKALYEEAGIDPEKIEAYTVNFWIAPRINATGRLSHGLDSLRLLLTSNKDKAQELAVKLGVANKDRQGLMWEQLNHARNKLGDVVKREKILIVYDESYHPGVIGLIAGKLTEEFYRPSIVLSVKGATAKASARSINGFDMVAAIRQTQDLLIEAGGHPMAAGFSVEVSKIEAMAEKLRQIAEEAIKDEQLQPVLKIDGEIEAEGASLDLVEELETMAPFGLENPKPVLAMLGVTVAQGKTVGSDSKHLKLRLEEAGGVEAIGFNLGYLFPQLTPGKKIDIAFQADKNTWNGRESVQLKIKDVRLAVE